MTTADLLRPIPDAQRVVDGPDQYHVQVDLGHIGRDLIIAITTALHRRHHLHWLYLVANNRGLTRQDMLNVVMRDLADLGALTIDLDDEQAAALALALSDASEEPRVCDCGAYIDTDNPEVTVCGTCGSGASPVYPRAV